MGASRMEARTLPAFLLSVFVFYWSLPLLVLTYSPTMCSPFRKLRRDSYTWASFMKAFFRVKVLKYGINSLFKGEGNVLYLCNHRSWADFFVDVFLTEGRCALLSRWLVFWVFPIFMSSCWIIKGVVLFKRGSIADKKAFNEWLDAQLKNSPIPGFLVYPEGHRSVKPTSLPLKRGMLYYAHSRGMPVQVILTRDKEKVISEKQMTVSWGRTVVAGFSQVIESKGVDFETFSTSIQTTWDTLWAKVYAADATGLPILTHGHVPEFEYTDDMVTKQAIVGYGSVLLLIATVVLSVKALLIVTGMAGAFLQKVLLTGLISWIGWSLLTCQAKA